jgi:hypothetical protein
MATVERCSDSTREQPPDSACSTYSLRTNGDSPTVGVGGAVGRPGDSESAPQLASQLGITDQKARDMLKAARKILAVTLWGSITRSQRLGRRDLEAPSTGIIGA